MILLRLFWVSTSFLLLPFFLEVPAVRSALKATALLPQYKVAFYFNARSFARTWSRSINKQNWKQLITSAEKKRRIIAVIREISVSYLLKTWDLGIGRKRLCDICLRTEPPQAITLSAVATVLVGIDSSLVNSFTCMHACLPLSLAMRLAWLSAQFPVKPAK